MPKLGRFAHSPAHLIFTSFPSDSIISANFSHDILFLFTELPAGNHSILPLLTRAVPSFFPSFFTSIVASLCNTNFVAISRVTSWAIFLCLFGKILCQGYVFGSQDWAGGDSCSSQHSCGGQGYWVEAESARRDVAAVGGEGDAEGERLPNDD